MHSPSLAQLPPPPAGRSGWPWTEQPSIPLASLPGGRNWPKISVVTPSYNQAVFLEETLRSVLLQGYPNLEYIVMDGGSTDESVALIRRYEPWLAHWESRKDHGQSHAVNKGWARASGNLLAYLNSDDIYLPGALAKAARAWVEHHHPSAVIGAVQYTDNQSRPSGPPTRPHLPARAPLDLSLVDHEKWFLPQQSGFWSAQRLDSVGRWLREDLHYTLDRELYYRLCRTGSVVLLEEALATYRFHPDSKSISRFVEMYLETPRSMDYCDWGGPRERQQRQRVAQWRIAQGHRRFVALAPERRKKVWHLLAAACYRPGYLSRLSFYRAWIDALGLGQAARRLWQKWRKATPWPAAPRTIENKLRMHKEAQ